MLYMKMWPELVHFTAPTLISVGGWKTEFKRPLGMLQTSNGKIARNDSA